MNLKCFNVNPFGENVYILWNTDTCDAVVVDPGMMRAAECEMIAQFLQENHLKVSHILLTHMHLDHVCGARWLANLVQAPVCASPLDAPLGERLLEQVQAFHLKVQTEPLTIDAPLAQGDNLTVCGEPMTVLHTPGHTPGGLSFYLPDSALLISGDTIFNGSVGRTDLPGGNPDQLIDSINERIMPLPDETVIVPGHGPSTTVGDERRHNPFL